MVLCGLILMGMIADRYYVVTLRTLDSLLLAGANLFVTLTLMGAHIFLISAPDILLPSPRPGLSSGNVGTSDHTGGVTGGTPGPGGLGTRAWADGDPDVPALAKLTKALEEDLIFTQESLTLGLMADRLRLPEYRLRQLINQRLGYRNFNQFLATHRVELAKTRLADPSRRHDKIIAIAFEVGFASLAPFNKAFREHTGMTPSAYRAAALAEDQPTPHS